MDPLELEAKEKVVLTNEIIESGYEDLLNNSGVRDQYEDYMEEIVTLEASLDEAHKEKEKAFDVWLTTSEYYNGPPVTTKTSTEAQEDYERAQQAEKQLETEIDHARKGYTDFLSDHVDHTALDILVGNAYQNYMDQEERLSDLKQQMSELEAKKRSLYTQDEYKSKEDAAVLGRLVKEITNLNAEIKELKQSQIKAVELVSKILFIYERKEILLECRRSFDKEFVVHQAMVECSFGMRKSFLLLPKKLNILIKGRTIFSVGDTVPLENFIPFGGCISTENKDMDPVVEEVLKELHNDPQYTVKNENADRTELKELCVCPCRPNIIETWTKGHSTVKIGGQEALLGRCELKCSRGGGTIIIRRTGQPE